MEGLEPLRLPPRAFLGSASVKLLIREALGYTVASGCALLVDFIVLWVLVQYFSWWYLAAATTSFLAGMVVSYALSVRLAFKHHRLRDWRAEFISFAAIGSVGLAVNAAAIFIAVKYFGLNYLVAKCVAAGFTFVYNFISRRQLLFVQRSPV
jgi:putative flippase GtrA